MSEGFYLTYLLGLNRPCDELRFLGEADQHIAGHLAVDGRLNVPRNDRIYSYARRRTLVNKR